MVQDINEIPVVLEPSDYSREFLYDSGGRRIGQIPKYKMITRVPTRQREGFAFGDDGQVAGHDHPARNGWIWPCDYSKGFRLSRLADVNNRDALVFRVLDIEIVFVICSVHCHINRPEPAK